MRKKIFSILLIFVLIANVYAGFKECIGFFTVEGITYTFWYSTSNGDCNNPTDGLAYYTATIGGKVISENYMPSKAAVNQINLFGGGLYE